MTYEICGGNFPYVIIHMTLGEEISVPSGAMSWMSGNMKMKTSTKGGLFKGLKRTIAGESLFMNTYTCPEEKGFIAIASSCPGAIMPHEVRPGYHVICQKRTFLAATPGVDVDMFFNKKLGSGFFGGEGFILQKISGNGTAFLEIDGSCAEMYLEAGEEIKVDTGKVAAFEESVSFNIEMLKGVKNVLFGGEGLFLTTLAGPGKVWLQSMPISDFAAQIVPFIPQNTD